MSEPVDLDATVAEIKAKSDQVRTALASIRGHGTTGNGTITATVDSAGHLRDLKLTPDALRFGNRLAALIVEAATSPRKTPRQKPRSRCAPSPTTTASKPESELPKQYSDNTNPDTLLPRQ